MKVDSHQHFWKYSKEEFDWIHEGMKVLWRDFLPADLEPALRRAGIDGTIVVQVPQTLRENDFLLECATASDFVRGVVGWAPLTNPAVKSDLEKYAAQPKFKGLRHIAQNEPDDNYLLRDDFNRGVRELRDLGLIYEVLIYERQLPAAIAFVDRHPDQVFVLNHIAKPRIGDNALEPWASRIRELSKRPNIYCKLSGLVTEADWQNWTVAQITPFIDTVLEAFGPRRLMFGSDWPVCLLATNYQQWTGIVRDAVSKLSGAEQERIWGGTAVEAYHL